MEKESSEESEDEESEESVAQNDIPEEVRRQRWFSDPMFADLSAAKEEESDEEAIQQMKKKQTLPLAVRLQAYSRI